MPDVDTKELKTDVQELDAKIKTYIPAKEEEKVQKYVFKRSGEMKEFRKSLGVEKDWEDADKEYIPAEIEFGTTRRRFETDQDTGLRSRLIPINDETQNWRSNNSDPMLFTKIQSALAIIIDKNPEAVLMPDAPRYESSSTVAHSIWKRNWKLTNAKDTYKLFAFNLMKYGWACGRSYPRLIKYKAKILKDLDLENPENNKYEEKEIVRFNDVYRENLDPKKTWIDETSLPYNQESTKECYYEIDYTYDEAEIEFGMYSNWEFVKHDSKVKPIYPATYTSKEGAKVPQDQLKRKDIVTIGFFQSRTKDLYSITIPKDRIILYYSPLPNDDKYLDIWHAMWALSNAQSPYGVGLWKIIRQDKELYDKMVNMTMDQIVLSIYKMFFYTGAGAIQQGDAQIRIEPGVGYQLTNGDIKWSDIPGPGADSFKGIDFQKQKVDRNSGVDIAPTMPQKGKKTLGEQLIEKEEGLRRMKIPLENIASAIAQDAQITLSWSAQILSTPEVQEFSSIKDLMDYEREEKSQHQEIYQGEKGISATFLPQISLDLEKRNGQLVQSKKDSFFQVGQDLPVHMLFWKGKFSIVAKSILTPSIELEKQRKMQLFNMLAPLLGNPPELFAKGVKQIIKVNEEDPQDWLPDTWLQFLDQDQEKRLFVPNPAMQPPMQPGAQPGQPPQPGQNPMQPGAKPMQPAQPPQGQVAPMVSALQKSFGNSLGNFNK